MHLFTELCAGKKEALGICDFLRERERERERFLKRNLMGMEIWFDQNGRKGLQVEKNCHNKKKIDI